MDMGDTKAAYAGHPTFETRCMQNTLVACGGESCSTSPKFCPRQQRLQSNPKWEGSFWSVQELLKEVGVLHVDISVQSKGYFESMLIEKEIDLECSTL
jgi:hypothetical protein